MSIRDRVTRRLVDLAKSAQRRRLLAARFRADVVRGIPDLAHVPIVICLWNRPERIGPIVAQLSRQTGGAPIDLHFWNNDRRSRAHYRHEIEAIDPSGALASVQLYQAPYNLGSIARFYVARLLAKRGATGPLIIIDDDEEVEDDFVATAIAAYDPAWITAFWAFRITGEYYWEREPAAPGEEVGHIGPGGSVSDVQFFARDEFFTTLPLKYWYLDDLWLSWFAPSVGIGLRKLDVHIEFVMEETNHYHSVGDLKGEFYTYLHPPRG